MLHSKIIYDAHWTSSNHWDIKSRLICWIEQTLCHSELTLRRFWSNIVVVKQRQVYHDAQSPDRNEDEVTFMQIPVKRNLTDLHHLIPDRPPPSPRLSTIQRRGEVFCGNISISMGLHVHYSPVGVIASPLYPLDNLNLSCISEVFHAQRHKGKNRIYLL